jgi:hypothetical protein
MAMLLICGMASSSLWSSVSMVDGSDSFSDVISLSGSGTGMAQYSLTNGGMFGQTSFDLGPGAFEFSEVTTSAWLKSNTISDDPYVEIRKSLSNSGSGAATSNMQFSDTPLGLSLLSGFEVDKNIDSAWASMYATDFTSWSVNNQISINKDAIDFLAGQKFDRVTWKLDNVWQFEAL